MVILLVLLAILGVCIFFLVRTIKPEQQEQEPVTQENVTPSPEPEIELTPEATEDTSVQPETADKAAVMEEAAYLAATYDYDAAIEKLNSLTGAAEDPEISAKITEYQTTRDSCVPVNMNEVTHIFYHSLVVDPDRGFAGDDSLSAVT